MPDRLSPSLFFRIALVLCVLMLTVGRAVAQQEDVDPSESARFRFGVLRFTPSITVSNLGVDNNVFNEPNNPKRDTTAAFGPATSWWLRAGRSRMSGKAAVQYLYFNQYDNQRAWNTADEGKWEIPLSRFTPFVTGSYSNTKSRPGFEIDSRARLTTTNVGLGTSFDLSGKTQIILAGNRARYAFDNNQAFLGADLADALNRTSDSEQLQVRYRLTSLTTFFVTSEAIQDRFVSEKTRNANSIRILPGFEMKPSALISGKVSVGYRRFEPLDSSLPSYQGPVASVDAQYVKGPMLVAVKLNRDLVYSYETSQPYYALTDLTGSITRRLGNSWDIVGRAGRQLLDYQQIQSINPAARTDTIRQFGGGVGYWVGRTLRVGFDANYYGRTSSQVSQFDYDGLRMGVSVSYGVTQ